MGGEEGAPKSKNRKLALKIGTSNRYKKKVRGREAAIDLSYLRTESFFEALRLAARRLLNKRQKTELFTSEKYCQFSVTFVTS